MDYLNANPATLTIEQLRRGITLMGGEEPEENVLKSHLIKIYADCQLEYRKKNTSRTSVPNRKKDAHKSKSHTKSEPKLAQEPKEEVTFANETLQKVQTVYASGTSNRENLLDSVSHCAKDYGKYVVLAVSTIIVFIISSICVNCINRRMIVNIGVIARPFAWLGSALLPRNLLRMSRSLTVYKPHECPDQALCDDLLQVTYCEVGSIKTPAGPSYPYDFNLKLHNRFYALRSLLRNIYFEEPMVNTPVYTNFKCVLNQTYVLEAEKEAKSVFSKAIQLLATKFENAPEDYSDEIKCLLMREDCSRFQFKIPFSEVTNNSNPLVEHIVSEHGGDGDDIIFNLGRLPFKFSMRQRLALQLRLYRGEFVAKLAMNALLAVMLIVLIVKMLFLIWSRSITMEAKAILKRAGKAANINGTPADMPLSQLEEIIFEHSMMPDFVQRRIMRRVEVRLEESPDICCGHVRTSFGDYQITFRSGNFELDVRDFSKSLPDEESTHEIAY